MAIKVYIDGRISGPEDAKVSVFDRGFLYGDSVYEVMRTAGGVPVDLAPHLDRLERSGASLALSIPERASIETAIADTLTASGNDESYIRVVVTRGGGTIGLDTALAEASCLIVIVRDLSLPTADEYNAGVPLKLVTVQRTSRRAVDPGVKSGNYLNNIMALQEAKKAGAREAIMCDATGRVAEGASSNVFMVQQGVVLTPPLEVGLLAGITRSRVMALARADGIEVRTEEIWPDQLRQAEEVFITSSVRGIMPGATVDGLPPSKGAPGPVTRRIMDLYDAYLGTGPHT